MPTRRGMAEWYNPVLLVQTGIRVAISTVFGEMADRREAMAAANAIAGQPFDTSFDYRERGSDDGFWFDFVADTGDGWNPTFAVAQLVTAPELEPRGAPRALPRGRVLLLGGDQVYPTASLEEYKDRFLYPFEEALERLEENGEAGEMPDLYAIPGNHDWYDGLSAFFSIFCRRRIETPGTVGISRPGKVIAGRKTLQTRSYFALRLTEGWWVWGTDSQLKGYIDQPQIDFFQYVASYWMEDSSKLILCVGAPHWAYANEQNADNEFSTFSYLERLASMARKPFEPGEEEAGKTIEELEPKGHQLKLVLTGDSHHYVRYIEPRGEGVDPVQSITCGGGGAFLHPTHQLTDRKFPWKFPPPGPQQAEQQQTYERHFTVADKVAPGGGKAMFPDSATSRGLTKANARFALDNRWMTGVYLVGYLLFNWILNMNARIDGHSSLVHALAGGSAVEAWLRYMSLSFVSPWPVVLFFVALGGYRYFADEPLNPGKRLMIGATHGLIQAGAAILITASLLWVFGNLFDPGRADWAAQAVIGLMILVATALAALAAATIFGLYLWWNLNRHGRHWNEAFSALAIEDYKCFLRLRIRPGGQLEVYPIGLEKTPKDDSSPVGKAHLIEGPIVIR